MPKSAVSKSRLPQSLALLFGLGALSAAGAGSAARPAADAQRQPGDLVVRCDGDRIVFSENGGDFRLLTLADTPEARRLAALLRGLETHPGGTRVPATVLAGNGGAGFYWSPSHEPQHPKARRAATPKKDSDLPQQMAPPQGAPRDPGQGTKD